MSGKYYFIPKSVSTAATITGVSLVSPSIALGIMLPAMMIGFFARPLEGILNDSLEMGFEEEYEIAARRAKKAAVPDISLMMQGAFIGGMWETVSRPVAYAGLTAAFAVDSIGYAFKAAVTPMIYLKRDPAAAYKRLWSNELNFRTFATVQNIFNATASISSTSTNRAWSKRNSLFTVNPRKKKLRN